MATATATAIAPAAAASNWLYSPDLRTAQITEPSYKPTRTAKEPTNERRNKVRRDRTSAKGSHLAASGQQFRVGSIGSNGLMYLSPIIRPAHERFTVASPTSPEPGTRKKEGSSWADNTWRESLLSGSETIRASVNIPPTPQTVNEPAQQRSSRVASRRPHIDTLSADIVSEAPATSQGAIKVVISQPPLKKKTKAASTVSAALIGVPIPHYRLGTPRFTGQGSAILQSSNNTGSTSNDDIASSVISRQEYERQFPASPGVFRQPRISWDVAIDLLSKSQNAVKEMESIGDESSDLQTPTDALLDTLPGREDMENMNDEDPSLIRMSSTTGQLIAATPARLIAQITSPSLLDYELLSDFFLTYRTFIDAEALMTQLIARLGWAVSRPDDFGRIVRVRTFVALRHWILNYFVDDFISDVNLRLHFCDMVNQLTRDLRSRLDTDGDIKIIRELKKCWSRTCALYWDMPRSAVIGMTDEDVLPGGRIGSRNMLEQGFSRQNEDFNYGGDPNMAISQWAEEQGATCLPARDSHVDDNAVKFDDDKWKPNREEKHMSLPLDRSTYRQSMLASAHIIPSLNDPAVKPSDEKPSRVHNRSGSFSDALRDDRMPLPTPKHPDYDVVLAAVSNIPGSLMRGALLPPPSPFLDMVAPSTPLEEHAHFSFETKDYSSASKDYASASSTSDKTVIQSHDGVKRLFGTVRRVLSTKQYPARQPTNTSFDGMSKRPLRDGSRRPFSAGPYVRQGGPGVASILESPEPRIDLLAAGVLESFKNAVKEEMRLQNLRANEDAVDSRAHGVDHPDYEYDAVDDHFTAMYTSENEDEEEMDEEQNVDRQHGKVHDLAADGTEARFNHVEPSLIDREDPQRHRMPSNPNQPSFTRDMIGLTTQDILNIGAEQAVCGTVENDTGHNLGLEIRAGPYIHETREVLCLEDKPEQSELTFMNTESGMNGGDASELFSTTISSTNDVFPLDRSPVRQSTGQTGGHIQGSSSSGDQTGYLADSSTDNLQQDQVLSFLPSIRTQSVQSLAVADSRNKTISLMSTHSSQPGNRGSSYDKEVAQLALLPDIADGSIESALLRLEGRYDRPTDSNRIDDAFSRSGDRNDHDSAEGEQTSQVFSDSDRPVPSSQTDMHSHEERQIDLSHWRHEEEMDGLNLVQPHLAEQETHGSEEEIENHRISAATSLGSYSSTPLLERNLSFHGVKRKASKSNLAHPPSQSISASRPQDAAKRVTAILQGVELLDKTSVAPSTILCQHPNHLPEQSRSTTALDNRIQKGGEPATPIIMDEQTVSGTEVETTPVKENESATGESEILPHPLRHPATPPARRKLGAQPLVTTTPTAPNVTTNRHSRHIPLQPRVEQQIIAAKKVAAETPISRPKSATDIAPRGNTTTWVDKPSVNHMPFVMGYDSLTIAQQMTLCEKDALSEIDWRELIEIRWTQTSPAVRDWVELLKLSGDNPRNQSLRGGIDICTARFNIMVKWAMSEIILMENINERAACIVKYIHIAQHARQLRNWATMYQITTALVNSDCSRLKQTWALVPYQDQETLKSLEALIMPMRNFHNLRTEIERTFNDVSEGDVGCIPFVGIYTHDLIYNAQKPAYLPNPQGGADAEPLINFERLHTAAAIVKNLLRLLEASSKYTFHPIPEVLSRCLWMATLSDEEISRRSEQLEPW